MQAENPLVEAVIQSTLEDESATVLSIAKYHIDDPPLTITDGRRIIDCLRQTTRIDSLEILHYDLIDNVAVLTVFRNGLPLCPAVTSVNISIMHLGIEGLSHLKPAFYNTSVRKLCIDGNNIQGQPGGEFIQDLLVGNKTLRELSVRSNPIGPEGVIGLERGLDGNNDNRLQKLNLHGCSIGNEGLANFLLSMGEAKNISLTHLDLGNNSIQSAEGGRQLTLLLQRFPMLKVLVLLNNPLGPLGASALAPGLIVAAAASQLELLDVSLCGLGNDGVANLIPDGQVNVSLTHLDLCWNNIGGVVGGENVVALAVRCTNLDIIVVDKFQYLDDNTLSPDHQRRLDLVLERKRLHTEAQALGSSPPSVIFEKLVQTNSHEHGLSASFVILRDHIFAEQHQSNSSADQNVQAAVGLKRKR